MMFLTSTVFAPAKLQTDDMECKKESEDDIVPRRFALKYVPPTLIVEYSRTSSTKLFQQRIRLKTLPAHAKAEKVAAKLRSKYPDVLGHPSIPARQVERLVARLLQHAKFVEATSPEKTGARSSAPPASSAPPSASSSLGGLPSLAPLGGPKSSAVPPPPLPSASKPSATTTTTTTTKSTPSSSSAAVPAAAASTVTAMDDLSRLAKRDLQRADPSIVKAAKKDMDVVFEKHRKKPGDEGYQWDVAVEFSEGEESNDWDEDFSD